LKIQRLFAFAAVLVTVLAAAVGLYRAQKPPTNESGQLRVTASFYPLAYFAQEIGGENLAVINLTPSGAEPHDFEPGTRDVAAIENSRLLLINGAGFESWAQRLQGQLSNREVLILPVAEGLAKPEGDTARIDPHVWLDPVLAQEEVQRIAAALIEIDPANRQEYEANASDLRERLADLDQEFRAGLAQCRQANIVTSHAAFGHLAARYGLKQISAAGLLPEAEPTPQDLAAVVDFVRENQVKYIFFETLLSPRLSETIARETGAQTLALNPLEGLSEEQQAAGENYFTIQRDNLENLRVALDCQ
jgi:zinc transport system substrate-binding protein